LFGGYGLIPINGKKKSKPLFYQDEGDKWYGVIYNLINSMYITLFTVCAHLLFFITGVRDEVLICTSHEHLIKDCGCEDNFSLQLTLQ